MILRIYKRKCQKLQNIIGKCSSYLLSGEYRLSVSEDVVYNSDMPSVLSDQTFASKNNNGWFRILCNRIINKFVVVKLEKDSNTLFRGTEVVVSSSQNEYKVFNYADREVITLFSDIEKQDRVENNKCYFSKFFNVPKTIEYIRDSKYQKEELISHVSFDLKDSYVEVLKAYDDYSQYTKAKADQVSYWKSLVTTFEKRFGASLMLQGLRNLPIVYTHGDLWSSNIIFDGNSYFITDFENGGYRFFAYDLVTFICSEWIINNNASLIDSFLSGEWDNYFNKVLNHYYKDVVPNKKELLLAFIVTIYYERWQSSTEMDLTVRYFLKKYVSDY